MASEDGMSTCLRFCRGKPPDMTPFYTYRSGGRLLLSQCRGWGHEARMVSTTVTHCYCDVWPTASFPAT